MNRVQEDGGSNPLTQTMAKVLKSQWFQDFFLFLHLTRNTVILN